MPSSPGEGDPRILCIAGQRTTDITSAVAHAHGCRLVLASTFAEALAILRGGNFLALVAALGTQGTNLLFDADGSSELLETASSDQGIGTVVFSRTACRTDWIRDACLAAGADAVVNTRADLEAVLGPIKLHALLKSASLPFADIAPATEMDERDGLPATVVKYEDSDIGNMVEEEFATARSPPGPHYAMYGPLVRWGEREARISATSRADSCLQRAVLRSARQRADLAQQLALLPRPLTAAAHDGGSRHIRFTVVSDTHHQHESVVLPPGGDVLLHCGDLVGNYGDRDIKKHFRDFVAWLARQAARYTHVVFIAGNHDTLLDADGDGRGSGQGWARAYMASHLPANVTYLQDSGVEILGVRLWGSPVTPCRVEAQGKRYYSSGFERTNARREVLWETLPEDVDVLLTHVPPGGGRRALELPTRVTAHGDPLLTARLRRMRAPPRVHCFGHDHDYFGVAQNDTTTFINAAQDGLLTAGAALGGCALEFDVTVV